MPCLVLINVSLDNRLFEVVSFSLCILVLTASYTDFVQEGGTMKRHSLTLTRIANPPPIPEPDYSLSESDEEDASQTNGVTLTMANNTAEKETSGNSNSSGSSSGTLAHSFSVEEIQKASGFSFGSAMRQFGDFGA